ncbi:MAG: hypothetical protein NTX39_02535 [Opitutae bacterium]|nr:hypothetical protein [Opitutae bacterium]
MAGIPVDAMIEPHVGNSLKTPAEPSMNRPVVIGYLGVVAIFIWIFCQFYLPGKGFTYLINFGSKNEQASLSKLQKLEHYVDRHSDGYDAQYYAQIALDPSLRNTQLPRAVDDLPYRARRWAGVMFSLGLCASVRNALLDGPSLLLIALGVLLVEKNRPWLATIIYALSGLGKETNLLGSSALLPAKPLVWKGWGAVILRGSLTAAPLLLWIAYLYVHFGPVLAVGARNFTLPFSGYGHKWQETLAVLPKTTYRYLHPLASLSMLIAVAVQFIYLTMRPQWQQAWWRVGATFAVLLMFLGDAVWEGEPSAASRVLLPMQFAFNVLVPSGRWWVPVLLLGNLTLLTGHITLDPIANEGYEFKGSSSLQRNSAGQRATINFPEKWYAIEHDGARYWMWSPGSNKFVVHNPHAQSLRVQLAFNVSAVGARRVEVRFNDAEIWHAELKNQGTAPVNILNLVLRPGGNQFDFVTDSPGIPVGPDPRPLAFNLGNLEVHLIGIAP